MMVQYSFVNIVVVIVHERINYIHKLGDLGPEPIYRSVTSILIVWPQLIVALHTGRLCFLQT